MNTLKRVGEFDARDGSGQRHRIVVYREMNAASDLSGSPGGFYFKTDSGNAVNRLERGKYEIVHSGTEVHSTNPNASWESA